MANIRARNLPGSLNCEVFVDKYDLSADPRSLQAQLDVLCETALDKSYVYQCTEAGSMLVFIVEKSRLIEFAETCAAASFSSVRIKEIDAQ